ncbi:IS200/IS605 family transposase [Pirellulales bacterium]|nr:IS200/IS605 family transposase [Pirellulales bacterium]
MRIQPYTAEELKLAYCCHIYYRWHTYRNQPHEGLKLLTSDAIQEHRPDIHVLNLEATDTEVLSLVSIRPTDSVSVAASKIKGGTSKVVRQLEDLDGPKKIFGAGYFACCTGPSTSSELDRYFEQQSRHHGYDTRAKPPVYGRTWSGSSGEDRDLCAKHAIANIRWHLVFATWGRNGAFTSEAAEALTECWDSRAKDLRIRFIKASFVPDHVHLAVQSHPAVAPVEIVQELLNSSQEFMVDNFEELVIQAGGPQLWTPSAYVGSVGDLANAQMQTYLRRWSDQVRAAVEP